jgi:hypothetical protein
MPNKPKEGLQTIHIRIEPELKDRLLDVIDRYNIGLPKEDHITQADIIREGMEREIKRIKRKLKQAE